MGNFPAFSDGTSIDQLLASYETCVIIQLMHTQDPYSHLHVMCKLHTYSTIFDGENC